MNKPPILTAVEAMAKIQIILQEGDVVISDHCKKVRMKERDVTYVDIITSLKKGTINRAAEWEEKYSNWKYRVEGFDKVGEELTSIVVIIDANLELFVITIF